MPLGIDSPTQAARKFHRLAVDVKTMDSQIAVRGAQVIKREVEAQLLRVAPKRHLNVGKRGAKVGVRYETLPPAKAQVRATGPFHLLESDTKKHRVPRTTRGRGRVRKANVKPIFIPGVGVRAWAQHPGTRGRHPWARGVAVGVPLAEKAGHDVLVKTVRGVFG